MVIKYLLLLFYIYFAHNWCHNLHPQENFSTKHLFILCVYSWQWLGRYKNYYPSCSFFTQDELFFFSSCSIINKLKTIEKSSPLFFEQKSSRENSHFAFWALSVMLYCREQRNFSSPFFISFFVYSGNRQILFLNLQHGSEYETKYKKMKMLQGNVEN